MRRGLVILMLLVGGCCVTEETRQLAQGVHLYQVRQEKVVKKLLNGVRPTEEEELLIVSDAEALTRATRSLSEILGEPEHPVEVTDVGVVE